MICNSGSRTRRKQSRRNPCRFVGDISVVEAEHDASRVEEIRADLLETFRLWKQNTTQAE